MSQFRIPLACGNTKPEKLRFVYVSMILVLNIFPKTTLFIWCRPCQQTTSYPWIGAVLIFSVCTSIGIMIKAMSTFLCLIMSAKY